MKKLKKASFIAVLSLVLVLGIGQLMTAATTFSIGDCDDLIANPSYPFLYTCPVDNCGYSSTMFTCTDNGMEVPIFYREPDCDNYYCIFE
jgi:hypothetical protein